MNDRLYTDWSVSVPDHVVNVNLPVSRHGSEGGAGVGSPGHVSDRGPEIVGVKRLAGEMFWIICKCFSLTCSPCPIF